jgi:hypothetical protein
LVHDPLVMSKATRAYAKAAGKARQAVSALSGKVGILNTLEGEHQEVSVLVDRMIQCARSHDVGLARDLLAVVQRELVLHGEAERTVFYGPLSAFDRTGPWIEHSEATHDEITEILSMLAGLPASDPQWPDLCVALRDALDDHIDEEEGELFDLAQELLSAETLRELDARYQERRHALRAPARDEERDDRLGMP